MSTSAGGGDTNRSWRMMGAQQERQRGSAGTREVWTRGWGWGSAARQSGWGQME